MPQENSLQQSLRNESPTAASRQGMVKTGSSNDTPVQAPRSLSIVIVRPPAVLPFTAQNAVMEIPPIGPAYLAATLKRAGHRVRIIDAFGEAPGRLTHHDNEFTTNGQFQPINMGLFAW